MIEEGTIGSLKTMFNFGQSHYVTLSIFVFLSIICMLLGGWVNFNYTNIKS